MIEQFIKRDEQGGATKNLEDVLAGNVDPLQIPEIERVITAEADRDSKVKQASPDIARVIRSLAELEAAA